LTTTYIAALGGGLGDVIVSKPVIEALIARGKTVLVMRTSRQTGFENLIPGLTGTIKESELKTRVLDKTERYLNLREHRMQTDYFWGGPEFERDYPNFRINDILNEMCKDLGIDADFEKPSPFAYDDRPELHEAIIFVPGTTVDTKSWSSKNWMRLKNILEENKKRIYVIGQPHISSVVKELMELGIELLPTPAVQDAIDVLSSARAVVSVDTGLMHIAVQQGTETVCLFQDPIYYRPYDNAHSILSKHCAEICVAGRMNPRPEKQTEYPERHWATQDFKTCLVPEDERCINSITVEDVLERLNEAMGK
jgi:ADP-heptose:LPS heptosyltransferase